MTTESAEQKFFDGVIRLINATKQQTDAKRALNWAAAQMEQLQRDLAEAQAELWEYRQLEADLKAFIESRPKPQKPAQPSSQFVGETGNDLRPDA